MSAEQATTKGRVLVVEDDADLREALCDTLELAGYDFVAADSGEAALAQLAQQSVEMVVSDVNMGGMDGHALLAQLRQRFPALPVLLITAYGQVDRAVDAIRNGAVDYLLKPFEPEALLQIVARYVDSSLQRGDGVEPVAEEASSRQLLQLARRVAETDSTVLILGESGTGKEVLAQYIHRHSPRAAQPFVAINCAAIPENMLEATLFGHEKGSFTGAYASAPGKFEQANGGTLLLDEISEMDVGLQAKLLRVLQEQEVERIGGRQVIKLDV
ncbi:MAG TPA: sigma-54 dependent transcriptional regulator, partial [Motiliproteus sp.]